MISNFTDVSVDEVKAYWNRRPCNIRHSTADIGTREYFEQVEARKYFVEPHIPDFADFARWRGKKVLEIGCGIGTDTINFARAGAEVTAVDLSAKSLELARKRAEVFGFSDRIKFLEADAEKLSDFVEPQVFDLIYSFGVIHHSPNPERIIEQIRENFVDADSKLKLMVYNRFSWKVLWILLGYGQGKFWQLNKIIAAHSEAQTGCPVTYTYTRKTAKRLLGEGFEAEDVFVDHIFPYRIPEYTQHKYLKEWYFRRLPENLFHGIEKILGWHLCLTARVK